MMPSFYVAAFWIFAAYFLFLVSYYLILGMSGIFISARRERQHEREAYAELRLSAFTVPVTIVIPVHNEEYWISNSVHSILNLNYPEYELIVVDDGSTDGTLSELQRVLDLGVSRIPYKDTFDSGKIRGIYHSRKYPQVTVLSKESGLKKAGALNAALNLAKFKYVCSLDSDTLLEPDALLKVIAQVQKSPEEIVGIGSAFGLLNGFVIERGRIVERRFSYQPVVQYQNLEYIRSFIGNRITWSTMNAMPIVAGGFQVWRRDILREVGGFDPYYSSEDLEFTFRVHDRLARNKKKYRILMLPYAVGWTEGPKTVMALIRQRNRWQRVTLEALWDYKHMLFNPRYKMLGLLIMPYFLFYEALGVFFEIASIGITLAGWWQGIWSFKLFAGFFLLMILCNLISSILSFANYNRHQRLYGARQTTYFVFLASVEMFWYRAVQSAAKLWGTVDFLLGRRVMDRPHAKSVQRAAGSSN